MRLPILVSYAYATKHPEAFLEYLNDPRVILLLDSGAFTAKNAGREIKLDEYCEFLDQHKSKIFAYLALDVIGNPKATNSNLQTMLRNGFRPVPVHVLGDDKKRMDELFELSDYVALGGLRRPHKGHAPKEYIVTKMKWAAGRNVHWLGYVRENMVAALKPFSCDSASWTSAALYGRMDVYLGGGRWLSYKHSDWPELVRNQAAMRQVAGLGYSLSDIKDINCWRSAIKRGYSLNDFMSFNVSIDSWVRYVLDIGDRYGTKLFLATTLLDQDRFQIQCAIERHSKRLVDCGA